MAKNDIYRRRVNVNGHMVTKTIGPQFIYRGWPIRDRRRMEWRIRRAFRNGTLTASEGSDEQA